MASYLTIISGNQNIFHPLFLASGALAVLFYNLYFIFGIINMYYVYTSNTEV